MFKLYLRKNATYQNPEIYMTYQEAKNHARGKYLIIERKNNTDNIIEYGEIKDKNKKRDDYER